MIVFAVLVLLLAPVSVQATTYYLSPTGSNGNSGLSQAAPWLTFAHALTNTVCGDNLLLMDGTYGDGTSTGKLFIDARVCTAGTEFSVSALNQRKAKIFDNGQGYALRVRNSAYINLDGLYVRSQDNDYLTTTAELGEVFFIETSHHINARGNLSRNPNRYGNNHTFVAYRSQDVLFEDNESYVFSRHCVSAGESERVVVRRQYCNPRGGKIPGGFSAGGMPIGSGDAVMSMYPCKDCVLENSIADGTESPMFLNEQNANFAFSVLQSGSKVLGSICYKCNAGNGVFPNGRNVADLNHTPQNSIIRDVAVIEYGSASSAIKCQDCVNATIDHVTVLGAGGATGISSNDSTAGGTAAQNSIFLTNIIVSGVTGSGLSITGHNTWSGDRITSNGNGTNFSPALPSNWTNTSTASPDLGTCKLWTPDGSANKGTGTGGSDRGATILYRYVDGILTTDPLWDLGTGEFPHGADDLDGTNSNSAISLKGFHARVNVNSGGCSFPSGFGGSGGGSSTVVQGTTAESDLVTTATPLTWSHTIAASQDRLLVCVGLWDAAANVGSVSSIDVSGQAMTLVKRQVTTPGYRAVEIWGLASPTSGTRTITATLTGTIVGALGRSMEFDATSGLNTAVSATTPGIGSALSVTAPTNTNELIADCTVSSKSVTFTHGADQTGHANLLHDTVSLLLAASTQDGAAGGVMSSTAGGSVYQAKVAVSLIAGTPDPSTGAVLTGTQYQIFNGFGDESTVGAAVAKNTQAQIRPEGFVRIRGEIEASVNTTAAFTPALYCSRNGGGYVPVMNTFNSNVFRYYGAGPTATNNPIPETGSGTLQKLSSGNYVGGAVLRDSTTSYVIPGLSPGQRVEMEAVVQFNGTASDVITCRWYNSNGTALAYGTNGTASILITQPGAIAGY